MRRSWLLMPALALTASCLTVGAPHVTSAQSAVTHAPRIRLERTKNATASGYGWSSSNWSGYALSGNAGQYNSITGVWTVPKVQATKGSSRHRV